MNRIPRLPLVIALLTLPIIAVAWDFTSFLSTLDRLSSRSPVAEQRLLDLQAGLQQGTIKVEPPERSKSVKAAVNAALSCIRGNSHEYSPYVEMTHMFLEVAVVVFIVQVAVAIGVPIFQHWRTDRTAL